jgi:hypothetical protein
MKKIVSFLAILIMSIFAGVTFGGVFDINPVIPAGVSIVASFISLPAGSLYSLLFTAPGGIATPFNFPFKGLPQFLNWNNVVPLTSLRIETKRLGVIHDWVAASIAACNGWMVLGAQAANIVMMRLANGYLPDEEVIISGVTSAAGAINFNVNSDCLGTHAFKTQNAAIVANNPTTFDNFSAVFTPTMAAGDFCQVDFAKGHSQQFNIADLASLSSLYQEVPAIVLNNTNAYIKKATYQTAAATPAYVIKIAM